MKVVVRETADVPITEHRLAAYVRRVRETRSKGKNVMVPEERWADLGRASQSSAVTWRRIVPGALVRTLISLMLHSKSYQPTRAIGGSRLHHQEQREGPERRRW